MAVDMTKLRIAQYGTRHGHAEGKLLALRASPDVELAGVFELDPARRAALEGQGAYAGVHWFGREADMLGDPSIIAVASEGLNAESLAQTEAIVRAGKHVWYDKPAGEDWPRWQAVVAEAEARGLLLQMGYMFRYHAGFARIAEWVRGGLLGELFSIRAHMSTSISVQALSLIHI